MSDITIISPGQPEEHAIGRGHNLLSSGPAKSPASPPPITTSIPPVRDWSATPRAQTRPEAEAEEQKRSTSQQRPSNLEGKSQPGRESDIWLISCKISQKRKILSKRMSRLLGTMVPFSTRRSNASRKLQMKWLR